MANERLTDQTPKTDKPAGDDVIHVVDISDITDNAAGSSRKMEVDNFFKGRSFRPVLGCLVYSFVADPSTSTIVATDWVVWMDEAADRLVIGIAKGIGVAVVPADFDDGAKFVKFYDGSSLLP